MVFSALTTGGPPRPSNPPLHEMLDMLDMLKNLLMPKNEGQHWLSATRNAGGFRVGSSGL